MCNVHAMKIVAATVVALACLVTGCMADREDVEPAPAAACVAPSGDYVVTYTAQDVVEGDCSAHWQEAFTTHPDGCTGDTDYSACTMSAALKCADRDQQRTAILTWSPDGNSAEGTELRVGGGCIANYAVTVARVVSE